MRSLHFDIDAKGVEAIILDLAATEKQVKFAMSRALSRTATALRTLSARHLRDSLELRAINMLRKRLKSLRLRQSGADGFTLWYGVNDMPASWFKGTPKQTDKGAAFRGREFSGAFVGKSRYKGRKTVFKRTGPKRLHIEEQLLSVEDKAKVVIEDEIFTKAETIFWTNFERDLRARVKFKLGDA